MPEFILLQCTRLDVRSVSVKYEFKMMYNGNCQSAVAAAAAEEAVMWGCVCVSGLLHLQHGAWRVGCCRVGGHLLHLIPGTVRVLPKNHMVVTRAGGQGNKTVT